MHYCLSLSIALPKENLVYTNVLLFLEDLTKAIDVGNYLDFSKAFEEAPHKSLLHKIESHGISCNMTDWIDE